MQALEVLFRFVENKGKMTTLNLILGSINIACFMWMFAHSIIFKVKGMDKESVIYFLIGFFNLVVAIIILTL